MTIKALFKNITIKQANIFTILVLFFLTMMFVGLLVEEMYEDYESLYEQNILVKVDSGDNSELLNQKQKSLKSFFIKIVLVIVTLSFILFAIFLGLNNIFNRLLQRDTQTFLDFFENAAQRDQVINPNMIFFKDFKVMIGYANDMVEKISEQKYALMDMNLDLEERVKRKTRDLQIINKNLEKEKIFSQELLKSQKEFLKYAVHETNTPLSVILTSIELYVMKNKKDRQLSKIEAAVKNIFSIYDDLSYLVKKDQVEYPKVVINIKNYLSGRIDFFTEVAELSRISFNYNPPAEELHIYFNETKLQRIIDNTITNAIKYTLANKEVHVSLNKNGSHVEFSMGSHSKAIKDTNKVFDAYYREEENRDGFGLGLQLVRTICDEEGVEIEVSSDDSFTSFSYKFKMMGA
ncbi:sensor histidine kinase [Candidatus Sulfurimonas baltica]|uniref:histidine kinase n=1 Tax=Candidatus Sulfurimonas baltica TaxID=2740404 RepID=A0A7S7LWB8_9BACT|nr:HAMP domain-containing sensor histidine kinase [Candidatus Sulfurimonas baltica]QOY52719.1 HAMP domain-containing histidine kinase [Candidatus Sulfurimonas baltica]